MRDSRITLFAGLPVTINSAITTTGSTLDFKAGVGQYVGDYFEGSPGSLPVELMFSSITSTNNNAVVTWEVSDNGSNWVVDQEIYSGELSVTMGTLGTKVILPTRLNTPRRYGRLKVVTSGMSGSSFILNAWVSDGVTDFARATQIRV
jgi:hypothetical protein